jgi:V8-like Glu-specific endopeptidase
MPITFSHRNVTVIAMAAITAGVLALAPQAGAGTGRSTGASHPASVAVPQDATSTAVQAATVRYWTRARIAAALRASGGGPGATKPATRHPGGAAPKPTAAEKHAVKKHADAKHAAANVPASPKRSLVKRLAKKAAPKPSARRGPAPPRPWLTGNTTGHGLRLTHGGAVADAVGKIFFTLDDEGYVCSGTLVGGKQADVVVTAAHCVTGGLGQGSTTEWATNWMFVPGFRDGRMPYGEYTARRFFVTPDWTGPAGGSEQYDVAFVRISTGTLYGGSGAASPPPGLPVGFAGSQDAVPASRAYVFGYPSLPPYTGLYPNYCAGPVTVSGGSAATSCGMTAGDSGGPWLAGFSPLSGNGKVVAVSTYKVSDNLSVLYGAVLGPQARALYERAVSLAR